MLSCEQTVELISAALDGQLSETDQNKLEQHLDQCPACSALFEDLQNLRPILAHPDHIAAPDDLTQRIMDRIAADPVQEHADKVIPFPSGRRIYHSWKKWAVSAAAIAIVVLGAVTIPGQLGMYGNAPASNAARADAEGFHQTPDAVSDSALDHDLHYSKSDPSQESSSHEGSADISASYDPDSAYCGILVVSGEVLPSGLDQYEYERHEDGTLVYTVPAQYFFSLEKQGFFDVEDPSVLTFGPSNAPSGLILIRSNS